MIVDLIKKLRTRLKAANPSDRKYFTGLALYGLAYMLTLIGLASIYLPLLWFGLAAAVAGIGFRMVNHA